MPRPRNPSGFPRTPLLIHVLGSTDALPDFQFRRVLLKGHFADPPILLGPRVYEGAPGVNLIQPFVRSPSSPASQPTTVLVNRGFITSTRAQAIRQGSEKVPPPLGKREGEEIVIEGMLKTPEGKGMFTPDNKVASNEWYWMDLDEMTHVAGADGKRMQPVIIDEIFGMCHVAHARQSITDFS